VIRCEEARALAAVLRYLDAHLSVIPVSPRDKTPGRRQAASVVSVVPAISAHLRRLEARARQDALGLTSRRIPFGALVRDTAAGRYRIAAALARLAKGPA
jgi:hypothetical protein